MFKRQYVSTLYYYAGPDSGDFEGYRIELRVHQYDIRILAYLGGDLTPQSRTYDAIIIVLILQQFYHGFRGAYRDRCDFYPAGFY